MNDFSDFENWKAFIDRMAPEYVRKRDSACKIAESNTDAAYALAITIDKPW